MFVIVCFDLFKLVYGPIQPFAWLFLLVVLRNLVVMAFAREAAGYFVVNFVNLLDQPNVPDWPNGPDQPDQRLLELFELRQLPCREYWYQVQELLTEVSNLQVQLRQELIFTEQRQLAKRNSEYQVCVMGLVHSILELACLLR